MGVGMHRYALRRYGVVLEAAFGHHIYHVGSSLREKRGWRDVDVRALLEDDEFRALFPGAAPESPHHDPKWAAYAEAFSALGREMTGLPIDFQVQALSVANAEYTPSQGHPRSWIGG